MTSENDNEFTLTPEQRTAVYSNEHSIVLIANAGSGKTEAVARRVLRLLEDSDGASRVLALTYTNKAADELRSRFRLRAGHLDHLVTTETLHGFAHSLVEQHGTRIGLPVNPELLTRDEDRGELLTRWRASQGLSLDDEAPAFLRAVDLARARLEQTDAVREWRHALASLPGLDYPGLLDAAHELLELNSIKRQVSRTYSHVIVDEAQNLSPAQYRLLNDILGLDENGPAAMLVGDDKQSIVSFAGADPALLQRFIEEHAATVIRLDANFRSAKVLIDLSDRIAHELDGRAATAEQHAAPGVLAFKALPDERAEGSYVADWVESILQNGLPTKSLAHGESSLVREQDIAVLGRSATALREIASALDERGIQYAASSNSDDWLEGATGQMVVEVLALRAAPEQVATRWRFARMLQVPEEQLVSVDAVEQQLRAHSNPVLAAVAPLLSAGSVAELISQLDQVAIPETADVAEQAAWQADSEEMRAAWADFTATVDTDSRTWSNFRRFTTNRQRGSSLGGVQLLTIHKAQGREFKAVAVVGMNEGQIPDFRARTPEDRRAELRTFYVATTRARRSLLLTRALQRRTRYGSRRTDASPYLSYVPGTDSEESSRSER